MKALAIESCTECPFAESRPNHNSDDSYFHVCGHQDSPKDLKERNTRIGRSITPPDFCPLPDYPEPKQEWE